MNPTPTPPSGINLWTVATTILSAALIAALSGIFSMYGTQGLLVERLSTQKSDLARLESAHEKLKKDFEDYKENTNTRLNAVDAVKTSFDNLTRYAERDRK